VVEVWLGKHLAPGLFAWVIPLGSERGRCGLASEGGNTVEYLKRFLRVRFGGKKYLNAFKWPVLTGGPISKTFGDGILLVGDVAGQTKPTTGGGVVLGGLCAIEAAKTVVRAVEEGNSSSRFLSIYERGWRKVLGKDFSSMLSLRRFLNKTPDDHLDKVIEALKHYGLETTLEEIVKQGDMDLQSKVIRLTLTNPKLLKVLTRSLGSLALRELRSLFNL
jgi:flavin-dependent dehydrogenase